ncbi:hypothetical protein HYALB_00009169 [Hymenoscyphus albidus]|uniref:Uncharacterized protein n=1 Tax=Hymenoscyphus albidus TaxID=595503 RepID=A0A9N9QBA5_9HELO|nr:hypothetical protein HYALB_00009169 [Hymenoscyphus albidus]
MLDLKELFLLGIALSSLVSICLRSASLYGNDKVEYTDQPIGPIGHVIGIHLGQSYSQVGVYQDSGFEIITDEQGRSDVPSYVTFLDNKEPLMGFEAEEKAFIDTYTTIYDTRRLIGRNFSALEAQEAVKELPYTVVDESERPLIMIPMSGEKLARKPQEISALILAKLKGMVEGHLNKTVKNAIITVPSYFNRQQRQATGEAAEPAGLHAIRIIDESVSIGIAYKLDSTICNRPNRYDCRFLLCNVGEEESELALLHQEDGVFTYLGTKRDRALRWSDSKGTSAVSEQLEIDKSRIGASDLIIRLLDDAKLDNKDVDGVVVTGGKNSDIVPTQEVLRAILPGKKIIPPSGFSPDQAIVFGAAFQGYRMSESSPGNYPMFLDVNELSLGFELSTGAFMPIIPNGTVFPVSKKVIVSAATNNQEKVVLRIFEGQRKIAAKNRLLDTLELTGLLKSRLEIELRFMLDENEVLEVWVKGADGLVSEKLIEIVVSKGRNLEVEIFDIHREAEKLHEEDLRELTDFSPKIEDGVIVQNPPQKPVSFWKNIRGKIFL